MNSKFEFQILLKRNGLAREAISRAASAHPRTCGAHRWEGNKKNSETKEL